MASRKERRKQLRDAYKQIRSDYDKPELFPCPACMATEREVGSWVGLRNQLPGEDARGRAIRCLECGMIGALYPVRFDFEGRQGWRTMEAAFHNLSVAPAFSSDAEGELEARRVLHRAALAADGE